MADKRFVARNGYISKDNSEISGSLSISGSLAVTEVTTDASLTNFLVLAADGTVKKRGSGGEGPQGPQGITGIQGLTGIQGIEGLQGIQGLQGTQGLQGITGIQGLQGLQGTQGLQGIQGQEGSEGGLSIVYDGIHFSDSTYTDSNQLVHTTADTFIYTTGTTQEWWFSDIADGFQDVNYFNNLYDSIVTEGYDTVYVKIARRGEPEKYHLYVGTNPSLVAGYDLRLDLEYAGGNSTWTGGTGSVEYLTSKATQPQYNAQIVVSFTPVKIGAQGPQGPQGTQGTQGPQGTTGTQGTTGLQGLTGLQGIQGIQGTQGTTGIQGSTGTQGITGTGLQGTTGTQGTTGIQGVQGISGESAAVGLTNNTNNYVITATGDAGTPFNGEQNLSFDGTTLNVTGKYAIKGTEFISGSGNYLEIGDTSGTDAVGFMTLQTANNATLLHLDDSGNVGIGTTAPLFNLQVGEGAGTIATTTIRLQNSYLNTNGNFGFNIDAVDNGVDGHDLRFLGRTSPAGAFSERVRIKNSGNVGIGTTTPLGKFDVFRAAGASGTSAIVISNGEVNGRNWALSTEVVTGGDFAILCSSATGGTPTPSAANTKLYITSGGIVGIGTTSPGIGAGTYVAPLTISSASTLGTFLAIKNTQDTHGMGGVWMQANTGNAGWLFGTENDGKAVLHYGSGASETDALTDAKDGAKGITIDTAGNVGIGTTNPNHKLVVAGNMAVSASSTEGAIWLGSSTSGIGLYRDNTYDLVLAQPDASSYPLYLAGAGNVVVSIDANNNETDRKFIVGSNAVKSTNELFSVNESGNVYTSGNLTVGGIVTAQEFHTEFVSASIVFQSGSTKFGDDDTDVHSFTGSLELATVNNASTDTDKFLVVDSGVLKYRTGAQLLSDIGGITGYAETDTLATVTGRGASTSTASTFSNTLTVAGGGNTLTLVKGTGAPAIAFAGTSDQATGLIEGVSGGGIKMYAGTGSLSSPTYTDTFNIKNGGDAYFNYNVGIGTNNPGQKLHVAGVAWINRPTNKVDNANCIELGGRVEFNNAFAAGESGYVMFKYPTYNNFLISGDYDGNIGGAIPNIQFGRQSTVYMHINSSDGNVGIGTTSPAALLHVSQASANTIFRLGNNTTYDQFIYFNGNNDWSLGMDYSNSNAFVLSNASSIGTNDRLVVTTGGNVGIGTTAPNSLLQVGEVLSSNKLTIGGYYSAGGGHLAYRSGHGSNSSVWDTAMISATDDGNYNGRIEFKTTTSGGNVSAVPTVKMVLKATGNLGIGTTNPSTTLDVLGKIKIDVDGTYGGGYGTIGFGGTTNGYNRIFGNNSTTDGLFLASATGRGIYFRANGGSTDHMAIVSSGNVGIGTDAPGYKLEVNGYIRANDRFYARNGTNTMEIGSTYIQSYLNSGAAEAPLNFYTGITEKMRIDAGGNVGINTTTPAAKLQVVGSADVVNVVGSGSAANTSIFSIDGNNGRLFEVSDDLSDSLFSVNTIAGLPVIEAFADNTVTLGAYNQYDLHITGSKIGFGTSTPVRKAVFQETANDIEVVRIQSTGGNSGAIQGKVYLGLNHFGGGNYPSTWLGAEQNGASGYIGSLIFANRSANSDTAPVERMRLSPGGNVIVKYDGTDYAYDFQVIGTTYITGETWHGNSVYPELNGSYDLGAGDYRWGTIYCEVLDTLGVHEGNLAYGEVGQYETGTVLVWKEGKNIPCSVEGDHMRMGVAVKGNASPLVQGAEPVLVTGTVNEGDYLITSDKLGHAKGISRAEMLERNLYDCVLGKALENGSGESYLLKAWITI
jgi:hypothetical protein